ncbi:MAG: ATP-binding protein [Solirubrobacteraceae bacterium]
MTERSGQPLVRRAALVPSAGAICLLVIIWALTGAGYFWPMWPAFGIAFTTGLVLAGRWGRRRPREADRGLASVAAVAGVVFLGQCAIWLMSGTGYFWPVWTLLGLGVLVGLWWVIRRPEQRSLEGRVDELTRTRSGALDVQASELRRIERDLHDGAQARLVALSMQLGRAEERLTSSGVGESDLELVRRAKAEAAAAIAELRDLARGISPPILADRGLEAAVQSLADRVGSNVSVNAEIPHRPPPVVETAAYFVVAEALTNAAKHAPGAPVRVTMWAEHDELGIVVADSGIGGADPQGGGLTGLRQRVEALDGWLQVISPTGEGTTVRAVLPCAW